MPKKGKNKLRLPPSSEAPIKKLPTTKLQDGNIHFRFDYFDAQHNFFSDSKFSNNWVKSLLTRLKAFQKTKVKVFQTDIRYKKSQYIHPIDWDRANLDSFGIREEFDENAWQFGLSKAKGRVHGFFIGDFFYIVWLDPEHRLYDCWKPN